MSVYFQVYVLTHVSTFWSVHAPRTMLNTLEVNNSQVESSMIEDANDKKPLIDVEKSNTKVMLSEASDTADDAPD